MEQRFPQQLKIKPYILNEDKTHIRTEELFFSIFGSLTWDMIQISHCCTLTSDRMYSRPVTSVTMVIIRICVFIRLVHLFDVLLSLSAFSTCALWLVLFPVHGPLSRPHTLDPGCSSTGVDYLGSLFFFCFIDSLLVCLCLGLNMLTVCVSAQLHSQWHLFCESRCLDSDLVWRLKQVLLRIWQQQKMWLLFQKVKSFCWQCSFD